MIVIAIIGILAAIALPAYARYMARARFTEVTSAVEGVKKQVELCIFADGPAFAANALIVADNCSNGDAGQGYNIRAAADYATKYVDSITVADGIITAQAVNAFGLDDGAGAGATYSIVPYFTAANTGAINWLLGTGTASATTAVDTRSTCIDADLC
jgi:Tfp pilus assembly major pilin PilA